MILAGPAVNILIAFVLFTAVLLTSSLNGELALSNLSSTRTYYPTVAAVQQGSPAQASCERATGS